MEWGRDKNKSANGFIQLVKYNIVGAMNTAVDFGVYQLLTYIGMNYALAQCISYSCGILNSYFFNSRWTFRTDPERKRKQFALFVAVNLISLGASVVLLKLCYDVLAIQSNFLSKLIVTPVVMAINFLGTKFFAFK